VAVDWYSEAQGAFGGLLKNSYLCADFSKQTV